MPETTETRAHSRLATEGVNLARDAALDRASIDKDKRTVDLSFASEYPVRIWGWREVLLMSGADLARLNDGGNLLENHNGRDVIGVVERAWIDGDKARATVRFSKSARAEEVWQDVLDGIRRAVSVGFRVRKWEEDPDERIATATDWEPGEVSLVGYAADPTVGVGRAADGLQSGTRRPEAGREGDDMPDGKGSGNDPDTRGGTPDAPDTAPAEVGAEKARKEERARIAAITRWSRKFGQGELAEKAIEDGTSAADFQERLLEVMEAESDGSAPAPGTPREGSRQDVVEGELVRSGELDERAVRRDGGFLSPRERGEFSFVRLIRALAPDATRKDEDAAGFEMEVTRHAGERLAEGRSNRQERAGGTIPFEILSHRDIDAMAEALRAEAVIQRIQQAGTDTAGGHLVAQTLLPGSFIDTLRNMSAFIGRVTFLGGLVADYDVPTKTGSTTGGWISEDADAPDTSLTFGVKTLRIKTFAAENQMTRRSLQQTTPGIEALVRSDIAYTHTLGWDTAIAYGTGASGQPKGFTVETGIGASTYPKATGPTYDTMIGAEETLETNNVPLVAAGYVAHPKFKNKLKTVPEIASVGPPVWYQGMANGHPADSSNQVKMSVAASYGDCIFAAFSQVVVGMWSGLDVLVDPYSGSTKGRLKIVTFSDIDVLTRYAKAIHNIKSTA